MNATESAENAHQMDGDAPAATPEAPKPAEPAGNVDKIRDILFGANMREYETRFARLEETLNREAADLRETTRKRFDSLENYLKKELEALQARLKTEREERTESAAQQSRESKDLGDSLARRIRDLDDQSSEAHRGLRQEILDQSRTLLDEIRAKHEDIAATLERRFQELRHGKTDRAALASLFTEVAMRLNDEFHIPGSD